MKQGTDLGLPKKTKNRKAVAKSILKAIACYQAGEISLAELRTITTALRHAGDNLAVKAKGVTP